jgi:integrative and conjugative element protein (TIGR02256 family)
VRQAAFFLVGTCWTRAMLSSTRYRPRRAVTAAAGTASSSKHEQLARQRWLEENSTSAYLGLWHTHPEPDPTPSGVDQRDWQRAVAGDTYEGDRLFFPIVGTDCIRIWTLSRRGTYRELKLENKNAQI